MVQLVGHVFRPRNHFSIVGPEWLCESLLVLGRHLACFVAGENHTTSLGRISSVGPLRVAPRRNRAREAAAAEAWRTNSGKTNTRARSEASVQELRLVLVADVHRLA